MPCPVCRTLIYYPSVCGQPRHFYRNSFFRQWFSWFVLTGHAIVRAEQNISVATDASVVLSFSVSFHLVVSIRWHGHTNDADIKCDLRQTASNIQAMFSFANGWMVVGQIDLVDLFIDFMNGTINGCAI